VLRLDMVSAAAHMGQKAQLFLAPTTSSPLGTRTILLQKGAKASTSVAISLALVAPVASQTGSIGSRTCAKWLDGREHQLSTTMETWVQGYLTSSNQLALALGLTAAPLLFPELLSLLDQRCKSTPNAYLANVVLDVIQSEFSRRKRERNEAPRPGQKTPKP
jgi:hypothetical protein